VAAAWGVPLPLKGALQASPIRKGIRANTSNLELDFIASSWDINIPILPDD
jgi:hypothetical protein